MPARPLDVGPSCCRRGAGGAAGGGLVTLRDKFLGCLLGAAVGDMAGAAVEAESPGYIAGTYRSVDEILSTESVPEFTGPDWHASEWLWVGRDDSIATEAAASASPR